MQTPPAIFFHNLSASDGIVGFVHQRIGELEKRHGNIIGCNIAISALNKDGVDIADFEVHLTIMVPGPDIHVSRHSSIGPEGPDIRATIRNAFDTARRLLDRRIRPLHSNVLTFRPIYLHGTVDRLATGDGWGFVIGDDGREFFFDRRGLVGCRWDDIAIGTRLRFREMNGEKGAFAREIFLE